MTMLGRVAAIDIGSNSILCTIAERSNNSSGYSLLYDEANVTGLSRGLGAGQLISSENLARSLRVIQTYKQKLDEFEPSRVQVVGTEAFRRAKNGEEIRNEISKCLGHEVQIIDGPREAELSFWSVQKDHPQFQIDKLVFDIGGASTELCWGNNQGIKERISLRIGSVVLTENFGLNVPASPDPAMDHLAGLLSALKWNEDAKKAIGIGVAGTMTSIIAINQSLSVYERSRVHGQSISRIALHEMRDHFLKLSVSDRTQVVGLEPARAEVFGGGLCIALALAEYFNWNSIECRDAGVRFGLIFEMLNL
jgi:exopolyphosphatase/guanosine-5'-triphosphate,3'-diphosphate pyrophosphatase